MNKKLLIGIIIVAILIGIASAISYVNNFSSKTNKTENTAAVSIPPTGRHLTVELNESVGVTANP